VILDYAHLYKRAEAARSDWATMHPFPHVCFDDFLDTYAYVVAKINFPDPASSIWKTPENAHTHAKSVTKRGAFDLKEMRYSDEARSLFYEFNSGAFLGFLERLSGISGLLGDPYLAEGGFHCVRDAGYLDIHADFSHHDKTGLERRLNLILYLNEGWKSEYGGALSLYDTDLRPCATFMPIANRCVIFETSETSYHGHPDPMKLPAGRCRESIALYYYTMPTGRPRHKVIFPADPSFVHEVTKE
jgi:hypothetical protein